MLIEALVRFAPWLQRLGPTTPRRTPQPRRGKITYSQTLLSHPHCEPSFQVLPGVIQGSIVRLAFPDYPPCIQGPDKGSAHGVLPDCNPAIRLNPAGNGRVNGVEVLGHGSVVSSHIEHQQCKGRARSSPWGFLRAY